jgi:hypothetical protein
MNILSHLFGNRSYGDMLDLKTSHPVPASVDNSDASPENPLFQMRMAGPDK